MEYPKLFDNVPIFKLILIGDSGVGKSSIIHNYVLDDFKENQTPTIAVQFFRKKVKFDGVEYWIHLWDTGGQERFESITSIYYRGSNGAMIVFDLSNYESFSHVEKWYKRLQDEMENGCFVVLIGNKSDLKKDVQISKEQIGILTKKWNCTYFQTSALEGSNVEKVFDHLIEQIVVKQNKQESEQLATVGEMYHVGKKSSCCNS